MRWSWLLVIMVTSVLTGSADTFEHPRVRTISLSSSALGQTLPLTIIEPRRDDPATVLPAEKDVPVLYFLHGRGRNHASLLEPEATRAALLNAPFYIVLPQGLDGWYIDSPVLEKDRYETYLEEVVVWVEAHLPVRRDASGRGIGGWSMGGYGAVRFAQRHPGEFGFVASVIGLLDFPREETLPEGQNYRVPTARFGSDRAIWRALNPLNSVDQLRGSAVTLVLSATGFERTMNERFVDAVEAAGISSSIHRLDGGHEFDVVQRAVPLVLNDAARVFQAR